MLLDVNVFIDQLYKKATSMIPYFAALATYSSLALLD